MTIIDAITIGQQQLLIVNSDPTIGQAASYGSMAMFTNGTSAHMFFKYGPVDTDWAEFQPLDNDLSTLASLTHISGHVIRSNGTDWQSATLNLDDLSDAVITSPSTGQLLQFNGTNWLNQSITIGTGNVVGPASSTDNAVARMDGTTGKLIQNSVVTISDTGNFSGVNQIDHGGTGAVSIFTDIGANTLTMGGASSTIVVPGNLTVNGTVTTINTTNLDVTDKLVTLNNNGISNSGNDAGIEIEENNVIVAYVKTGASTPITTNWLIKAPDSQELNIDLSGMTAGRTLSAPDLSGIIVVSPSALIVTQVPYVDGTGRLTTENGTGANNHVWDATNNRLGVGVAVPLQTLHVAGTALINGTGSEVRHNAVADYRQVQGAVNTVDETVTSVFTFVIPTDSVVLLESRITGRRTGGLAGSAGDSCSYIRTARYKNIGGTVTMSNMQSDYTSEDQSAWGCILDANGTTARVRINGAANNDVSWTSTNKIQVL